MKTVVVGQAVLRATKSFPTYEDTANPRDIDLWSTLHNLGNWQRQLVTHLLTELLTDLLTYLLNPWSRVLLEKLNGFRLVKKFPAFYGTRMFITAFTSARHLSLSCDRSIQSTPSHHTSWRSILIFSSIYAWVSQVVSFPEVSPTKSLYMPLLLPIRATSSAHLILPCFITRTIFGEQYRSLSSSLCNFLHSPVAPSLLRPNILLNTLFSNTLSLRSSVSVSDQVSHP